MSFRIRTAARKTANGETTCAGQRTGISTRTRGVCSLGVRTRWCKAETAMKKITSPDLRGKRWPASQADVDHGEADHRRVSRRDGPGCGDKETHFCMLETGGEFVAKCGGDQRQRLRSLFGGPAATAGGVGGRNALR